MPVALATSSAAPVGVHSSRSTGPPYDGTPRSSSATAGAGTGQPAVLGADVPAADRDRGDHEGLEPEVLEPGAGTDHVGDRVQGPDLVEVHVVDRGTVHGRLGLGQPGERRERAGAHAGVERRLLQQGTDVAPGAVRVPSRRR